MDVLELAWHTQKNQMSDVKGKEKEQEREGEIKNEDIDLSKTKYNYDIVNSDLNLYQRVKDRVTFAKENGSRVQKNSVVMYSNILTVPEETAKFWGEEKTARYFETCYEYFSAEFGKENVVSAKVHLDETTPHMHLHFVPFNKDTGKLQARVAMNKAKVNHIHDSLPAFLQENGFDVVRGRGKTKDKNIEDVHEYKEVVRAITEKESILSGLSDELSVTERKRGQLQADLDLKNREIKEAVELYKKNKSIIEKNLSNVINDVSVRKKELDKLTDDLSQKQTDLTSFSSDLSDLVAQIEQNKRIREEQEKELAILKSEKQSFIDSLERFKGDLSVRKDEIDKEYEKELETLKTSFERDKQLLIEEINDLQSSKLQKNKALEKISEVVDSKKAELKTIEDYLRTDLKPFTEEFLGKDKVDDYQANINAINERVSPVKAVLGFKSSRDVKMPVEDFEKLVEYAGKAVEFRDNFYDSYSSMQSLEKRNADLRSELSQEEYDNGELVSSNERLTKKNEDLRTQRDDSKIENRELKKSLENHYLFLTEMNLVNKFKEWQRERFEKRELEKRESEKQKELEKEKLRIARRKKAKEKDSGLEL